MLKTFPKHRGINRVLPPLPSVALPSGSFNYPFSPKSYVERPVKIQKTFSAKIESPGWDGTEQQAQFTTSVSPPVTLSFSTLSKELSIPKILALVQPRNINRTPPLQLCGQKRKNQATISSAGVRDDDEREKHRVAEGRRRKNLSQLLLKLDSHIHDVFLERAGWNSHRSFPQSKEHIIQGAIYLIEFLVEIAVFFLCQEKNIPPQLLKILQIQLQSMELQ